jgi:hypothetical protein
MLSNNVVSSTPRHGFELLSNQKMLHILFGVALSPQTQKPNQGLLIDMLCLPCNVYRLLDKGKCFNMSVVFILQF